MFDGPLGSMLQRLDAAQVVFRLQAVDGAALLVALREMGYQPEADGAQAAVVGVPAAEADGLLTRLVTAGINVTEAKRQAEDLEGAYLRLVRGDGRPQ